jgi:serine/threonine protein kinase
VRLPPDQVVDLGIQIADALEAAHDKGLIHRDLKPANLMLTRRGQAKLLDFGLAKSLAHLEDEGSPTVAQTQTQLTGFGAVLGTVAYMSPEQVRGETLDARTDIFSLGAVLYEMATGRRAFPGNTSGTISDGILNRTPVPAGRVTPGVPANLEGIINKSLEKDRALRYQTASDVRADLQRLKRDADSARVAGSERSNLRHGHDVVVAQKNESGSRGSSPGRADSGRYAVCPASSGGRCHRFGCRAAVHQ